MSLVSNLRLFLTLLLISMVIILFDSKGWLDLPKGALEHLTSPVQYGLYKTSLGVARQFEFILRSRTAAQEKKALEEQLATITSENADLRRRLAETQGFLDVQKSLDPKVYNLAPARPISLNRYLIIDQGSSDNLKINMPVVYKDTLLGLIRSVSPNSSEVVLTTDPDSKVAAFVQNAQGKARGVLSGQFGSEMLLDKILHTEPINTGDLVYSEGTEGTLPRGLVLGSVTEVDNRENEIFKQAKVKSIFSVADLDIVFVITN